MNMRRLFCVMAIMVAALLPRAARAQLTEDWVQSFHVPGGTSDEPVTIGTDDSGYVYVVGITTHPTRDEDVLWMKYRADGTLAGWITVNGSADSSEIVVAAVVTDSGQVYAAGRTYSGPPTGWDMMLIKFEPNGAESWIRAYDQGWDNVDYGRDVKLDADGNAIMAGQVWDEFVLGVGVVKYSPGGAVLWNKSYHQSGTQVDDAAGLACDAAGNIYVCGWSMIAGNTDILTMKLDADGDTLWTRRYDGPANGYDVPVGVVVDDSGGVYVAGTSAGIGSGPDLVVIKYDSLGAFRWTRRVDGGASAEDFASDVVLAPNGSIYVAGTVTGSGTYFDGVLMRCRPDGQSIGGNFNTFPSPGFSYDDFLAVAANAESDVFAVGASSPQGNSTTAINTRQFDPVTTGEEWGAVLYADSGNAYGVDLCFDKDGNLYVTGRSWGGEVNRQDITTGKYLAAPVAVFETHSDQFPQSFELYQNVPNPFNASTSIRFNLSIGGTAELSIFNILGQAVLTHAEGGLAPGVYTFEWDGRDRNGRDVPSGVYLYRLVTDGARQTRKMALMK